MYWNPNKDKRKASTVKTTFILNGRNAVQGEGHTEATPSIDIDYQLYMMATPCTTIHYMGKSGTALVHLK